MYAFNKVLIIMTLMAKNLHTAIYRVSGCQSIVLLNNSTNDTYIRCLFYQVIDTVTCANNSSPIRLQVYIQIIIKTDWKGVFPVTYELFTWTKKDITLLSVQLLGNSPKMDMLHNKFSWSPDFVLHQSPLSICVPSIKTPWYRWHHFFFQTGKKQNEKISKVHNVWIAEFWRSACTTHINQNLGEEKEVKKHIKKQFKYQFSSLATVALSFHGLHVCQNLDCTQNS